MCCLAFDKRWKGAQCLVLIGSCYTPVSDCGCVIRACSKQPHWPHYSSAASPAAGLITQSYPEPLTMVDALDCRDTASDSGVMQRLFKVLLLTRSVASCLTVALQPHKPCTEDRPATSTSTSTAYILQDLTVLLATLAPCNRTTSDYAGALGTKACLQCTHAHHT